MISRLHLTTLLVSAAIVGGIVLLIDGVAVQFGWLSAIGSTVSVMCLLILVFNKWVWSWRLLRGWFVERPDLRGTWRVRIDSSWVGEDGKPVRPIEAFLVIRQTFSMLSLRILTRESSSDMIGCTVERAEDGLYRVVGTYRNRPRISVRDRSPIHFGAIALDVQGEPASTLAGHYWTDRMTRGELVARDRMRILAHSFDEARAAVGAKTSERKPATAAANS